MLIAEISKFATFSEAFAASREVNAENFIWRGERYNTKLLSENTPKKVSVITRLYEE